LTRAGRTSVMTADVAIFGIAADKLLYSLVPCCGPTRADDQSLCSRITQKFVQILDDRLNLLSETCVFYRTLALRTVSFFQGCYPFKIRGARRQSIEDQWSFCHGGSLQAPVSTKRVSNLLNFVKATCLRARQPDFRVLEEYIRVIDDLWQCCA
jgi:hypothetical protein